MRSTGARSLAFVAVLALAATGCAGPPTPFAVGTREFATNVLFGSPSAHPLVPVIGPVAPQVAFPPPSVVGLPPAPVTAMAPGPAGGPTSPTSSQAPVVVFPVPSGCPQPQPLAPTAQAATAQIFSPPASARYPYRVTGSFQQSGANAQEGAYPPEETRTVSGVQRASNGSFTFQVTEALADQSVVDTFQVIPTSTAPTVPASTQPAPSQTGLFLVSETHRISGASPSTFTPDPALQLLQLPVTPGASYDSSGTDPNSQTTMGFSAQVGNPVRVNACGTWLQGYPVTLTSGFIVSPSESITFTASYVFGTEYGGLALADNVSYQGTDNGSGVARKQVSTIDVQPRAAS
ncbi:MAG: hypothetical protein ACYDAQ_08365 [Mycobacteriales bacterium]